MKIILLLPLLFCAVLVCGQEKEGDFEYETKHRSQPWFSQMKDGANYFEVKRNFDQYFGTHKWETSKARQLGVSWLKTKLFYLDAKGMVQPSPLTNPKSHYITNNQIAKTTTRKSGSWNLIGPVESTPDTNNGGYVYLNRIDPTNTKKMFVCFITGGLWMSVDGGRVWTLVDANMPDEVYRDLDVAISDPEVVYAISHSSHVIKSTDGGLNWQPTALTRARRGSYGHDIAVSTTDPNLVVARWGGELYRTIDGGTTWSVVLSGLPNHSSHDSSITAEMLDWSTTNPKVVYSLSTRHNNKVVLHRSGDSGATFTKIATITLDAKANGQVVGWAKLLLPTTNKKSIYVAVGSGTSARAHHAVHLYKLNATTGAIEDKKINMLTGKGNIYAHDPVLHHGDIAMDRNDEQKIAWGSYGNSKISISKDGGKTFKLSGGSCHTDIRALDYVNGDILVGSDGNAVVFSKHGKAMRGLTNSISNHELWGFGSSFKGNLVATGNNHGPLMIKEDNCGQWGVSCSSEIWYEWYSTLGADQGNTDVNPLDDRYIYSRGYGAYRLFRTGVHAWRNESNSLDLGGIYSYFNSVEFHPNLYYTLITHHAGGSPQGNPNLATWKKSLIRTDDNGNSVYIVKTFGREVFREKISMKNPDHIYVVEGKSNNKLWHTADGGKIWNDITPSTKSTSGQRNISDIAVSDEKPNEVWVTYSGVQSKCKVIKSDDHGLSWTNLTEAKLTNFPMTKIIFQRGSDGGVYVANASGVYYRNNVMDSWEKLGTGLPMADMRFMFINYNENKLKIGTSRGAFSHDLYEISPPNALISASTNKILCPAFDNKVQFKDYSVVRNTSATWKWTFEGGTPATSTEENPEVSYAGVADGKYDVTLTVTDKYGTSSQTLTDFIEITNQCGTSTPEPTRGNMASFQGNASNDYITLENLDLKRNSFTFSCWIKPKGTQPAYSGIFSVQDKGVWLVLNFIGGNTLGFHPHWGWSSGLKAPAGKWSHVALVSDGKTVKIYLNGKFVTYNAGLSAKKITKIDLGRYGLGWGGRSTNLEMDEVSIWNRALTTDEIRKWRHLTKTNASSSIVKGLVHYYQFNEQAGDVSINKGAAKGFARYRGASASNHLPSSAPVFSGKSQKLNINAAGKKDFSEVGITLDFDKGTYPGGDVWVFRSDKAPDVLPKASDFVAYAIINNYGRNLTFSPLKSMAFALGSKHEVLSPSSYSLYKRGENAFGDTWGEKIDVADGATTLAGGGNNITFSTDLQVKQFAHFAVVTKKAPSITLAPTGLTFPDTKIKGKTTKELTIFNTGKADLKVTKITYPTGFTGDWSGGTIAKGGSQKITVTFSPLQTKTYSGAIRVLSDATDPKESTKTIAVSGKGALVTSIENLTEPKVVPIVYPNPLGKSKFLSVEIPAGWVGSTMVIYDTEGKKVAQMTLSSGKNRVKISTSAGLHHVTIFNANHKHVSKIMLK